MMIFRSIRAGTALACFLSFLTAPAGAALINFDDLPAQYQLPPGSYIPGLEDEFAPLPLTDQYEHLGVLFGESGSDLDAIAREQSGNWGAGITTNEEVVVSPSNAAYSGYSPEGFFFRFIGDDLPDYVSFYVSAPAGAMSVLVTDSTGFAQELALGYTVEDGEFAYTETPNKVKVEFYGDGIEEVNLSNFFGHRSTQVVMDDLYFTSAHSVPEPATLPLLLAGLAGLAGWQGRRQRQHAIPT